MYDVIVVGGGAAGMMAAISSAKHLLKSGFRSPKIVVLEQNEKLGKKIYITGKGRCNLTNASDVEDILNHIATNYQFMYSSLYSFTNDDVVALLEQYGCKTKVERGNRVFPVSDHASDVTDALARAMRDLHVSVRLRCKVRDLCVEADSGESDAKHICRGVWLSTGEQLLARRVIVATGGCSYPTTGSTGDGYTFAKSQGHRIVPVRPGLVPFVTKEPYIKELQGLSLRNVQLTMYVDGKPFFKELGELLYTHFGVSGPLVLSASAYLPENCDFGDQTRLVTGAVDLKPALSDKQLNERILRDFDTAKNKVFKNALDALLPKKLIPVIVAQSGIPDGKKVHDITKEERLRLVALLKHLPFTVVSLRGFQEAIITKGGVDVKEIDPGNMESKRVSRLHFAGEVLDLDAVTGGYNLQIAWSTGWAAGTGFENAGELDENTYKSRA